MTYRETLSKLVAESCDFAMLPTDGMQDELMLIKDGVLPYLREAYTYKQNFKACAQLFRSCAKYAVVHYDNNYARLYNSLERIYVMKNHDYGNAWEENLDEFGIVAMAIRMKEKVKRILSTMDGAMVKDESQLDTLCDICNYCVMTGMWIVGASAEVKSDLLPTGKME